MKMKKTILSSSLIALLTISSLKAEQQPQFDYLTGDTKLSCEAILCLSSPIRPSECMPSLARYFGISFKKFSDTMKGRLNFLSLCPVVADSPDMQEQVNSLSQVTGYCTEQELNAHLEKSKEPLEQESKCYYSNGTLECNRYSVYGFRTSPTMTRNCEILSKMRYNDYKGRFRYTCKKEFYTEWEWNAGKKAVKELSEQEYNKLNEAHRIKRTKWENTSIGTKYQATHYYEAIPIKKDCWVDTEK